MPSELGFVQFHEVSGCSRGVLHSARARGVSAPSQISVTRRSYHESVSVADGSLAEPSSKKVMSYNHADFSHLPMDTAG